MDENEFWDSAAQSAEEYGKRFEFVYGKVGIAYRFIIFPEGGGKPVAWVEGQDPIDKRQSEVKFHIVAIDAQNMTRPTERTELISGPGWSKVIWPSLRDLGLKRANEANGKWAKIQLVPSGRKSYINDKGVTVTPNTCKFLELYDSEEDATAAYERDMAKGEVVSESGSQSAPAAIDPTVLGFLPAMWKAANGSVESFKQSLASSPVFAGLTVDSPEVQAIIGGAA